MKQLKQEITVVRPVLPTLRTHAAVCRSRTRVRLWLLIFGKLISMNRSVFDGLAELVRSSTIYTDLKCCILSARVLDALYKTLKYFGLSHTEAKCFGALHSTMASAGHGLYVIGVR